MLSNSRNAGSIKNSGNAGNVENTKNAGNSRNVRNSRNTGNAGNSTNVGNSKNTGNIGNTGNMGNRRNVGHLSGPFTQRTNLYMIISSLTYSSRLVSQPIQRCFVKAVTLLKQLLQCNKDPIFYY